MSLPDATAAAAMDGDMKPVWFAYLDFVGDPARANTTGIDITVAGSGQPDLDGDYVGIDNRLVEVSPLKITPGGNDTVTVKLSGLPVLDDSDRSLLADPANWQGRVVRLWRMIRDLDDVQQGGIQHYYTGYMMALSHRGNPQSLSIEISIESYLAAFSAPSNRSYLDQESFDENDKSAQAAIATANGNFSSILTGSSGGGMRGGGGDAWRGGNGSPRQVFGYEW